MILFFSQYQATITRNKLNIIIFFFNICKNHFDCINVLLKSFMQSHNLSYESHFTHFSLQMMNIHTAGKTLHSKTQTKPQTQYIQTL